MNSFFSVTTQAVLLSLAAVSLAQATCLRDDVDHYLAQGFTPAQIVELCGDHEPDAEPVSEPVSPPASTAALTPEMTVLRALKVNNPDISTQNIAYDVTICLNTGVKTKYGYTQELCPELRLTIDRQDLQVVKTRKGFLLADSQIELNNAPTYVINNLDNFSAREQAIIKRELAKRLDRAVVPVYKETPLPQIAEAMQALAN